MNDQVKCPHCGNSFSLPDVLTHQLEEQMSKKYSRENEELREKLNNKDKEIVEQKRILWQKALVIAEEKIKDKTSVETLALKEQIESQRKKINEAQKIELELRRERIKLEQKEKELDLIAQRKIDEERKSISENAYKKAQDENRFKELGMNKQIEDMRKQIEELKRKSDQGSQQLQGEIPELFLENILKTEFPMDEIKPVPKGILGADVLQIVKNKFSKSCGIIIWESKRTKVWQEGWVAKLKEDQREAKAEVAIIISQVLPKDFKHYGQKNGVLIGSFEFIIGLASLVRMKLIELATVKSSLIGKQEKKEYLWNYLQSTEFKHRLEAIDEAIDLRKKILEQEKKWFKNKWATEEKAIELLSDSLMGIGGDLKGIMGKSLPEIKGFDMLPAGNKEKNEQLF
ncbi:hypothetical protein A2954_07640 [Candidatus Roizmanbacteria bacterium RIFCSPLOWO2_01_FULL_37_12]|uniref:DUF2130 domain-containing protein n=1 Tax=Candidatus Roizmanbacteria bacterium RIFCSPLOWO2_01_FULL_37_12 TaxID=1802056 RepID=A0A1F7IEE9_9BACT|nr:MAG: hypothetical protein A3D76_05650 [Candidatus Roizmanbacteria bacterium RIFCSPHIGHO2_02_FULL_37_9b]OGK41721.1 MAG: hypothetical protein A2954_07640 [Candidatus Roizmanbacteria bacterium RIFCSPLOWO2_01_FULL_37_12]